MINKNEFTNLENEMNSKNEFYKSLSHLLYYPDYHIYKRTVNSNPKLIVPLSNLSYEKNLIINFINKFTSDNQKNGSFYKVCIYLYF